MLYCFFFCFQLSSAQILSLGNGQLGTPVIQNFNQNVQRTINLPSNSVLVKNNGFNNLNSGIGIGNLNSGIGVVNSGITGFNSGIGNLNSVQLSTVPVNNNVQVVKNVNLPVSGIVTNGNIANNVISSNLATNNLVNVGSNFGGSNVLGANLVNVGVNSIANVNSGANWVNANVPVNIANGFNINTGTFAVGNTGLAALLPQQCGIQILADALEVGGKVAVNGQLPFYTTVAVNGQLPSSGVGVVNCGCGQGI